MSKAQGKFDFSVHHPFKAFLNRLLNLENRIKQHNAAQKRS